MWRKATSILMLIFSIPMAVFSSFWISYAAMEFTYGGVGCLIMAVIYLFSAVTAVIGLIESGKPDRRLGRTFAWIQLGASLADIVLMLGYAVFLLPPILLDTILFLCRPGKIKGREVIPVSFDMTLDELYAFMQENWDTEEYNGFEIGRPTPASIEKYIYLPATQNCLVIAYPRKGKIIFSVADNPEGLKLLAVSAIPTRNAIARIYQSSLTISRAKEFRGPAAEACAVYAEYMRTLLKQKDLL